MRKDKTIELQRHLLGSIDLSDLESYNKELTEQERKDYCAAIFAIFPRLEKDIKKFLYEQLIFSSMKAATWEEVLVGRGVFAGAELLLEHWRKANDEHMENTLSKEEFEKEKPISEI